MRDGCEYMDQRVVGKAIPIFHGVSKLMRHFLVNHPPPTAVTTTDGTDGEPTTTCRNCCCRWEWKEIVEEWPERARYRPWLRPPKSRQRVCKRDHECMLRTMAAEQSQTPHTPQRRRPYDPQRTPRESPRRMRKWRVELYENPTLPGGLPAALPASPAFKQPLPPLPPLPEQPEQPERHTDTDTTSGVATRIPADVTANELKREWKRLQTIRLREKQSKRKELDRVAKLLQHQDELMNHGMSEPTLYELFDGHRDNVLKAPFEPHYV